MKVDRPVEKKLKNGCRYVVIPVKSAKKVALTVSFNIGTHHFSVANQHVPHLLEHLLLSTGDGHDINETLSHMGAQSNAMTDDQFLSVVASVPNAGAMEAIKAIFDTVYDREFSIEAFEKERGIVLREIHEKFDGVQERAVNYLLHQAYPTAFPEAWDEHIDHVEKLQYEKVRKLYREQICPQNMTVIIVADPTVVDVEEIEKQASAIAEVPSYKPKRLITLKEPSSKYIPFGLDLGDETLVVICFDTSFIRDSKKRTAASAADFVLFNGPTAIIDAELRNLGAVYSTRTELITLEDRTIEIFSATVERKLAPKAVAGIIRALYKVADGSITGKELTAIKSSAIATLDGVFESADDVLFWHLDDILRGRATFTPEEEIRRTEKLTADDIAAAATEIYTESFQYWAIASNDAAFWTSTLEPDMKALRTLSGPTERDDYLATMTDTMDKALLSAPERYGYYWVFFYGYAYIVLLVMLFLPALQLGKDYFSWGRYGVEAAPWLLVPVFLMVAAGALGWVRGEKERIAERGMILLYGLAAPFYLWGLFGILDGLQTLFHTGWHGWLLLVPTLLYVFMVPPAVYSVVRLLLINRSARTPRLPMSVAEGEQTLLIHGSFSTVTSDEDSISMNALYELEEALEACFAGTMYEVDGHEIDEDGFRVYCCGSSADDMYKRAKPILKSSDTILLDTAELRYDETDDAASVKTVKI
jgi:predicted Zn-dependent peptidase